MKKYKSWLRKLVARCIPISSWMNKYGEYFAWLSLMILIPASVASIKISIGNSELSLYKILAIILPVFISIVVIMLIARRLDMFTRSIGGLKLADIDDLEKPVELFKLRYAIYTDLPKIAQFADNQYLGTMPAGLGPTLEDRLQKRIELYRRMLSSFKYAFYCIENRSNELVGFTLVFPISKLATDRYLKGVLSYTEFQSSEMINDGDGASIFIAVTLATDEAVAKQQLHGFDLLGQTLVQHIAKSYREFSFSKLRIITSGYGYWGNKAFKKKGFIKHYTKDRDRHIIMILDEATNRDDVAIQFLRVVRALSLKKTNVVS